MELYISLSQMADQGGEHFKHGAGLSLGEKQSISFSLSPTPMIYTDLTFAFTPLHQALTRTSLNLAVNQFLWQVSFCCLWKWWVHTFGDLCPCLFTNVHTEMHTQMYMKIHIYILILSWHPERLSRDEILLTLISRQKTTTRVLEEERLSTNWAGWVPARGSLGSPEDPAVLEVGSMAPNVLRWLRAGMGRNQMAQGHL